MSIGLLLFAHGARDPHWALPFEDVVRRVRASSPGLAVELAFLEFMSPGLLAAASGLVKQGCSELVVLPLFLGAGGHVRKDLPEILKSVKAEHPQLKIHLKPAIGEVESVLQAMANAAVAATTDSDPGGLPRPGLHP